MKKAKMVFWVIVFGFMALLAYQNWGFFAAKQGLKIDLLFFSYETPKVFNAILFLAFFFIGLLITYFFSLLERFKSRKTIKSLSSQLEMNQKMLDKLKNEVSLLKGEQTDAPLTDTALESGNVKDPDAS